MSNINRECLEKILCRLTMLIQLNEGENNDDFKELSYANRT